jgi:hypothetical protein
LEKSLRADVDGYVNSRLSSLQEEIARLQSQFNEAFTRILERVDGAADASDAPIAVAISEHLRNARNEGIERAAAESTRARASSDIAIIKAAIDDLDSQRSQADILNTLVNRAASFAPRIAFFVIKNERATGWRARGLEGTVGDDTVREISLPLSSDTLLAQVTQTRRTWSGGPGSHAADNEIYSHFGEEPPQRVVAIPMVAREKAVAVLYADSAGQDSDAVNLEALESLVRVAGMAVELLATKRPAPAESRAADAPAYAQRPSQPKAEQPPVEQAPVEQPSPAPSDAADEAARTTSPDEEPAPPPASDMLPETPVHSFELGREPVFAESTHAIPESAPAPAPPAPPAPVPPMPEAAPSGRRRYGADAELPIEVREEEKRPHNEARRFARLLVSEIKLYNEQQVSEGRANGDLYNRLREDINRARQAYDNDRRITPEIAGRFDYFHHELVNQLAGGDPGKLGEGYPGATVSV